MTDQQPIPAENAAPPPAAAKPAPSKSTRRWGWLGVILLFVALVAGWWLNVRASAADYRILGEGPLSAVAFPGGLISTDPILGTLGGSLRGMKDTWALQLLPSSMLMFRAPFTYDQTLRLHRTGMPGLVWIEVDGGFLPAVKTRTGYVASINASVGSRSFMPPKRGDIDPDEERLMRGNGQQGTLGNWVKEYQVAEGQVSGLAGSRGVMSMFGGSEREWSEKLRELSMPMIGTGFRDKEQMEAVEYLATWRDWNSPRFNAMFFDFSSMGMPPGMGLPSRTTSLRMIIKKGMGAGDAAKARDIVLGLIEWQPGGKIPKVPAGIRMNNETVEVGLELWRELVLDPKNTAETIKSMWEDQELMLEQRGRESWLPYDIALFPSEHLAKLAPPPAPLPSPSPRELAIEADQVTAARIDLMRQGVRVMYERRTTGQWPALDGDAFTSLTLEAKVEPADGFNSSAPFKVLAAKSVDDPLTLYSLGPDGVDQRGTLVYDPVNGLASPGDLLLTLKP